MCQGIVKVGWAERNKNQRSKSENKGLLRRNISHLRDYSHGVMISLWHLRSVGIKKQTSMPCHKDKEKEGYWALVLKE